MCSKRGNMGSMAVNELGPMLTATEVAEMLHLHVNTVKRLGDRGELPFYRVCKRGDRRFRLDDVMKFSPRTANHAGACPAPHAPSSERPSAGGRFVGCGDASATVGGSARRRAQTVRRASPTSRPLR